MIVHRPTLFSESCTALDRLVYVQSNLLDFVRPSLGPVYQYVDRVITV